MKRIVICGAVVIVMAAVLRTCLFAFYEYRSVLVLPSKRENQIKLADSLSIDPYLSIEDNSRFVASINFEKVVDSFTLSHLEVKISGIDNAGQLIKLTHVLAYKFPVIPEYIDYVRGDSFNELPEAYKTISKRRQPWNTITFRFETNDIEKSNYYNLKITGTAFYKGNDIHFEKAIKVKRTKRFMLIRMMT